MTKHDHKTCKHPNLKHCEKCDVIECLDCPVEWTRIHSITTTTNNPWASVALCRNDTNTAIL